MVNLEEAVNPILEAIRIGRTDILRTLLDEVRTEAEKVGEGGFQAFLDARRPQGSGSGSGRSLLFEAAKHDNSDALRTLVQMGADPSLAGAEDGDGAQSRLADECSDDMKGVLMTIMFTAIASKESVHVIM